MGLPAWLAGVVGAVAGTVYAAGPGGLCLGGPGADGLTPEHRAQLLIQQASQLLTAPRSAEHGVQGDLPNGRSVTSLLNEIKALDSHVGPLALGELGPLLSRPTGLMSEYRTAHFLIHYAAEGIDRPLGSPSLGFLDAAGAACERAWTVHHTQYGWPLPLAAGDGLLDVFVKDLGWGAYGYTLHESAGEGSGESGFIVMDNDFTGYGSLSPVEALQVTLAHEYRHLVQFGFGYAPEADWFMEQCATMMEGQVCPENPDRYRYLPFFAEGPYHRLDLSNGSFEYGAWLWPQFLFDRPGWGMPVLIAAWDAWRGTGRNMLEALDVALQGYDASLEGAFREWAIWNAFLGRQDDGRHYPRLGEYPCAVGVEARVTSYPAESLRPALTHQPERLGASYLEFVPEAGSPHNRLELRLQACEGLLGAHLIAWPRGGGAPIVQPVALSAGAGLIELTGWNEAESACLVIAVGSAAPTACDYAVSAHTRLTSADVDENPTAHPLLRLSITPNPFDPCTVIAYELPAEAPVSLRIFDAAGRVLETLVNATQPSGNYVVEWRGPRPTEAGSEAGVFFCEIRTPEGARRLRLVHLR